MTSESRRGEPPPPGIGILGSFESPNMDAGTLPLLLLFPPHQELNSVSTSLISPYRLVQNQNQTKKLSGNDGWAVSKGDAIFHHCSFPQQDWVTQLTHEGRQRQESIFPSIAGITPHAAVLTLNIQHRGEGLLDEFTYPGTYILKQLRVYAVAAPVGRYPGSSHAVSFPAHSEHIP